MAETEPASSILNDLPPIVPDHELLHQIGRGSYGSVWLARNVMGTWRAVKVVRRASFDSDRPYEREFAGIRRSEPISRSHEGMVNILHMGRRDEEGFFFYVMELADALTITPEQDPAAYQPRTLSGTIRETGALSVDECLRLVTTVAGVLAHLHQFGLIHRDVKPSNILYFSEVAKLGDIGLVAEANSSRSFVGTEGYVPSHGPGSERADIYGLGKTLYEALTGLDRTRYPEIPANWAGREDLAKRLELNELVLRACDPDAAASYSSASQLVADAALIASGMSVRRLRGLERAIKRVRGALIASIVLAVIAGLGWMTVRRESALETAKREAELARWQQSVAQVMLARTDITGGRVTEALQAAAQAAKVRVSPELRDATAELLCRPDLIALPHGTASQQGHCFLPNPAQRCYLWLEYPPHSSWLRRLGKKGFLVSALDGTRTPLPPEFIAKHAWKLAFIEGGTVLTDGEGLRWTLPGTKPVDYPPAPVDPKTLPRAQEGEYESAQASADGQWRLGVRRRRSNPAEIAYYPYLGTELLPFEGERQKGGGSRAVFLEPGNFLATSTWRGMIWIEDLLSGKPAVRWLNAGGCFEYCVASRCLSFQGWEGQSVEMLEWKPSPVLHSFKAQQQGRAWAYFAPDSRRMFILGVNSLTQWQLDTENTIVENYRHPTWPTAFQFIRTGSEHRVRAIQHFDVNEWAYQAEAVEEKILTPLPSWSLQKEGPGLDSGQFEGGLSSTDGRTIVMAELSAVYVWRDKKLTHCLSADVQTGLNWSAHRGDWHPHRPNETTPMGVRVDLSKDGRWLAIGSYHGWHHWVWDLHDPAPERPVYTSIPGPVPQSSFSPDGRYLAISSNNAVRVLEIGTWREVFLHERPHPCTGGLTWAADGSFLIYQPDQFTITLLRSTTWEELLTLKGKDQRELFALSLSPDLRWLYATEGFQGHAHLWDLRELRRRLNEMSMGW